MKHPKTLVLILAGGEGSRLEVLTRERAKPALHFAGTYRLIDFALSNCMHSHLSDVWVIEQYQLHSLNEHLSNGRPWDLDRTYGGLQVLPPFDNADEDNDSEGGFASGNADAIYRHRRLIGEFAPDILVVLSADHLYTLDLRDVIDRHIERDADVTAVTTRVSPDEASRFGLVKTDEEGRITDFQYKPDNPQSDLATTEIFVYNAPLLLRTLDELASESELEDFGHQLLPHLVQKGRAWEFRFEGYWRDVGTVESYWQAHRDLLQQDSPLRLDDPQWPILSYGTQRLPSHVHGSAHVENSLLSSGSQVRGHVVNSVLSPGVIIEEGALVRDSILGMNVHIRRGAQVHRAIIDEYSIVGENARVGEQSDEAATSDNITLVGRAAQISSNARIETGARIEPGEEA